MKSPSGKELNGKLIRMKAKKGWTVSDFAVYFGVSEDEFLESAKKAFQEQSYKNLCVQLDRNQKRRAKNAKKRAHKIKVTSESVQENQVQEKIEGEKEMTVTEIINELKEKEEFIRKELCQREGKKSSLIVRRNSLYATLRKHKDEILKWECQILRVEKEVDETIRQIQEASKKIEIIKEEMDLDREALESLRKEIVDLEKVSIFVYENGEIEAEGIELVVIPESWEDIYRDLSKEEVVEDLTIKQIRMLSKTMAFLGSIDKKFEVTFEINQIQEVFDRIVAERGGNN